MPSEWACHDFAGASITDKVCITCGVNEMNLRRQNCFTFWDQYNATPLVGSPVNGLIMSHDFDGSAASYKVCITSVESKKIKQLNVGCNLY